MTVAEYKIHCRKHSSLPDSVAQRWCLGVKGPLSLLCTYPIVERDAVDHEFAISIPSIQVRQIIPSIDIDCKPCKIVVDDWKPVGSFISTFYHLKKSRFPVSTMAYSRELTNMYGTGRQKSARHLRL